MSQSELTIDEKNQAFQHLLDYERYHYIECSLSDSWFNLRGVGGDGEFEDTLRDLETQQNVVIKAKGVALAAAVTILLPHPDVMAFMMAVAAAVYEKNTQAVVDEQVSLVRVNQVPVE